MNKAWLMENADFPIKYGMTQNSAFMEPMLLNSEVKLWLGRLADRVMRRDLSDIHGSHDYRYENIIGKCFILGLHATIAQFDAYMRFFLDFLEKTVDGEAASPKSSPGKLDNHTTHIPAEKLTFGKMYQYRDCETMLSCYLPFLGYAHEESVRYVAYKRANIIYEFTKQERYDVYRSDLSYPGANKAWKPYILDPDLYHDGNIALPSIHDLILFAGMYPHLDHAMKEKVETTVRWLFGDQYEQIHDRLYYYAPADPSYKSKAINSKVLLPNWRIAPQTDMRALQSLLFLCFVLSHFESARAWVSEAIAYLGQYKTEANRYIFPTAMITEKKDAYVIGGGHMNVGEKKNHAKYAEIISTYWMERIIDNLS